MPKIEKKYYPALDGIRGYLIFMVIGFHLETHLHPHDFNLKVLFDGKAAVDVFFVISGFLITKMLLTELESKGKISLKAFYIRRFFRLLPVFLFTILVYLSMGYTIPGQEDVFSRTVNALPYHLTMRSEYIPEGVDISIGHAWSLSVEEKFYLVWPALLFCFALTARSKFICHILPLLLAPLFWESQLFYAYLALVLGSLLACYTNYEKISPKVKLVNDWVASSKAGYISAALFTVSYIFYSYTYYPAKLVLLTAIVFFVLHLILGRSFIVRFFSMKFNIFMGQKAYSMYLLHMVFLTGIQSKLIYVNTNTKGLLAIVLAYFCVLIFSTLVATYIEKPMMKIGRRISNKLITDQS